MPKGGVVIAYYNSLRLINKYSYVYLCLNVYYVCVCKTVRRENDCTIKFTQKNKLLLLLFKLVKYVI